MYSFPQIHTLHYTRKRWSTLEPQCLSTQPGGKEEKKRSFEERIFPLEGIYSTLHFCLWAVRIGRQNWTHFKSSTQQATCLTVNKPPWKVATDTLTRWARQLTQMSLSAYMQKDTWRVSAQVWRCGWELFIDCRCERSKKKKKGS